MRSKVRPAFAVLTACALAFAVTAPAGAQVPDAPPLGFEIDPIEGPPGTIVNGQVDVADVEEHCVTDVETLQERFLEYAIVVVGEFLERYPGGFPDPPEDEPFPIQVLTDHLAWSIYAFLGIGVTDSPEAAAMVLPQLSVLTFADIATQELVGVQSNFDPATGQGSVPTPDVAPGMWAVAAACVMPTLDLAVIEQGVAQASAWFVETYDLPPFVDESNAEEIEAFYDSLGLNEGEEGIEGVIIALGPQLLSYIVEFDALGFALYCVTDASGVCEAETPPAGTGPGGAAQPVGTQPRFTG